MQCKLVVKIICISLLILEKQTSGQLNDDYDPPETWTGRWFPERNSAKLNPDLVDHKHGVKMGIPSDDCDNGKMNLTVDWDHSPEDYFCFRPKSFIPNPNINPVFECEHIPPKYVALHKCMDTEIKYSQQIPTFGTHRPLWAKYGEYLYLPIQRWLHNLEHGAVAMLYHPCANPREVNILKRIVKNCVYRHVITPSKRLSPDRPLALVTWGCRLTMSKVDETIAAAFIKTRALRGPEHTHKDGQFDVGLLQHANVVSEIDDKELCPFLGY